MEQFGIILFRVLAIMTVLLIIWLAMGKRQLGEFTPFDFAVSITAGTVAGAGIADTRIDIAYVIIALFILGVMQIFLSWLSLKFRFIHSKLTYRPAVLVDNGQIIKQNLRKTRLTAEMLLQLLREKEVFDITEVELAVLEPHGKLSVLKKAEYQPLTPSRMNLAVPPNRILLPVILEGELQQNVLKKMGFTEEEIDAFTLQCGNNLNKIFIAFMDKNQQLHIISEDARESGVFLR